MSRGKPILPPEIILEILKCRPETFLSVAKWPNREARKIIDARPVLHTYTARNNSFYTLLEGMAGLRYSA